MTDEVERRLRSALAARAGQITPDRLRFGTPPTVAVPVRPVLSPLRRWLPALAVAVATAGVAAAVVLSLVLRSDDPDPQPILPAGPQSATTIVPETGPPERPEPSPARTASPLTPSPAASSPPASPSRDTEPSVSRPAATPVG